jgi:adenosylcobinamide-phosphate synthase
MVEAVALAALMVEAAIGWPDALYRRIRHPVGLFARIIEGLERRWNDPARREAARRFAGILLVLLLLGLVGGGAWLIEQGLRRALGQHAWPLIALLAAPGLAQRSLHDHVTPVARALAKGDLTAAREAVGRIVGRDTAGLDAPGVARAAIESLAESFCDGVAAPLFWLLIGGLPGIWAYKALNTADSLIGHREPRWRAFGWAAARADDVANWVPARIAGLLLCAVSGRGLATMLRDARRHASPNAGWPEAAMAGALGVRLAGPVAYDGVMHDKPWIGGGRSDAGAADIARALGLYWRGCLSLWLIAGGCAWVR